MIQRRRVVRRSLLACLVAAVLSVPPLVAAEETAAAVVDVASLRIPHHAFTLDNGLTVLVHEDHSVPIVAVNLWYHVGSKNEERGRTGFAHLFEHFFFNGSENHPSGFREAMDDIGANNRNGTTNADRTNFFEDVPVSALERTLWLEADRMGFLAGYISEEMLERERGVVQNEKRSGENQPYGRVFDRMLPALYPASHPYSWSTIGSMEDLDAATLEDVREWYAAYYGPNNAVLSLAGDVTAERARELVERYFGPIPPGPPITRFEQWIPTFEHDLRDRMQDRVPQSRVYRAWHAPAWGEAETQHLRLFADVLSGTKSAPLDRRLVYDTGLATEVGAFLLEREIASGLLLLLTVGEGGDPAAAEREMDAAIAELLERGPTDAELRRAKSRIVRDFARGTERLGGFGGRSDVLAESATYTGDPEAYLEVLRLLTSATPAEVQATAKKWLTAPSYTLVVEPFPELAAGEETIDRSIEPALAAEPTVTFPEIQRATLQNGLELILLERHSVPLVNATLAVDAGYASDAEGGEGTASLALDLVDEGTPERDAFEIIDALDELGAQIQTGSELDLSTVSLRALAPNLAPSLDIFADVVRRPAFPADLVALETRRRLAQIAQEKASPVAAALRIAPGLLYPPEHPYSAPMTGSGTVASVSALERDDLVAWHRRWFRPERATLVVAGDVTMEALLPMVRATFGDWRVEGPAPEKRLATAPRTVAGTIYLVDKPDAPQSVIVATHLSEPGGDPADLAMETVMRLFGGMSTSRLNRNLRLDKHWSYGTWGMLADARGQRPFAVIAPVQTDKTREAMEEIRAEIRGIAGERPVVGEEFASIRRNMVLRLPGRYETLSSLENAALEMINLGYPEEYLLRYADNVRALGEADLATAAGRFIRPDELVWIVIGDLGEVEASIRDLGWGELVRLDADGRPLE